MPLRNFERRPLADNSPEYKRLKANFQQSEPKQLQVLHIDKVFNFKLEKRYKERLQRILAVRGPHCCVEPIPLAYSKDSIGRTLGLGEAL